MSNIFTDHPKSVCMSYEQHMRLSLRFASIFASASVKAVAHAFFPCCFITSTSDAARSVSDILSRKGCRDGESETGSKAGSDASEMDGGDGATTHVESGDGLGDEV